METTTLVRNPWERITFTVDNTKFTVRTDMRNGLKNRSLWWQWDTQKDMENWLVSSIMLAVFRGFTQA